jgi:hypothetical protein
MSTSIPTGKNDVLRGRLGWVATAIVSLALIAESHLGQAADVLSIADFVGHFRGEAQVQAGDRFFVQQVRDAEVELRSDDNGFRLSWTTVIHSDEGDKTNDAPPQRRDAVPRRPDAQTSSAVSSQSSPSPRDPRHGRISIAHSSKHLALVDLNADCLHGAGTSQLQPEGDRLAVRNYLYPYARVIARALAARVAEGF